MIKTGDEVRFRRRAQQSKEPMIVEAVRTTNGKAEMKIGYTWYHEKRLILDSEWQKEHGLPQPNL